MILSKKRNVFFCIFLCGALFLGLLFLELHYRGVGWDGDSLVQIAQFNKLANYHLYGVPDTGTTPKFLLILIFGIFHQLTSSTSIHLLSMMLMAIAVGSLTVLPKEEGGGFIWISLPFVSPEWTHQILSADNTSFSLAFLILAIGLISAKRPNYAILLVLLAELSRPGAFFILILLLFIHRSKRFKDAFGTIKPVLLITCLFIALINVIFFYKLSYASYDIYYKENFVNPDNLIIYENEYSIFTVISDYFNLIKYSLPTLISPVLIMLGVLGWLINISNHNFRKSVILWSLFLLPILPVLAAGFIYKSMPKVPLYYIFIVPPILAGISLMIGRVNLYLFKLGNFNKILSRTYIISVIILSVILAIYNGNLYKDKFEYNLFINSRGWSFDPSITPILEDIKSKNHRKLSLMASCDVVPLLIKISPYISNLTIFSDELTSRHNGANKYLITCNCSSTIYLKRDSDLYIREGDKIPSEYNPDLIYTTEKLLSTVGNIDEYKVIPLKYSRYLLVKKIIA